MLRRAWGLVRRACLPLAPFYYGPADWLVAHTTARGRRAFGFWNIVGAVAGTPFFGGKTLYVTVLSIVALFPNVTSETPVEGE